MIKLYTKPRVRMLPKTGDHDKWQVSLGGLKKRALINPLHVSLGGGSYESNYSAELEYHIARLIGNIKRELEL